MAIGCLSLVLLTQMQLGSGRANSIPYAACTATGQTHRHCPVLSPVPRRRPRSTVSLAPLSQHSTCAARQQHLEEQELQQESTLQGSTATHSDQGTPAQATPPQRKKRGRKPKPRQAQGQSEAAGSAAGQRSRTREGREETEPGVVAQGTTDPKARLSPEAVTTQDRSSHAAPGHAKEQSAATADAAASAGPGAEESVQSGLPSAQQPERASLGVQSFPEGGCTCLMLVRTQSSYFVSSRCSHFVHRIL